MLAKTQNINLLDIMTFVIVTDLFVPKCSRYKFNAKAFLMVYFQTARKGAEWGNRTFC